MTAPQHALSRPELSATALRIDPPAAVFGAVEMRVLRPDEASVLSAHLKRLDTCGRRMRFNSAVNDLFIESYASRALLHSCTVGLFIAGTLRGVAELQFVPGDRALAEGAFSLETCFRRLGFGTRLFRALLGEARAHGIERLVLQCLRENVAMQRIARAHAAEIEVEQGEVVASLRRRPDEGFSAAA